MSFVSLSLRSNPRFGLVWFGLVWFGLVWFGLNILCSGLFLVHELFQVSIPDELSKKNLQSSAIFEFVSFLLVIGTLPSLIAPFGVPSQWIDLLEVWFISNLGKELVY